jgi:hypothetical protein
MLIYLVQRGLLTYNWVEDCPLAVWMQKQIRTRVELLDPADWMEVTYQNSKEFAMDYSLTIFSTPTLIIWVN